MSSGPKNSRLLNSLFEAACLALALQGAAPAARAADIVDVHLNQAKLVDLPGAALTVIIGNPTIVDVTMLPNSGKIVLTGKGFGETNLIAVNGAGLVVNESLVRVTALGENVIVQRGLERESYHCSPRCQPTVALGDDPKHMGQAASQISTRNAAANSGGEQRR